MDENMRPPVLTVEEAAGSLPLAPGVGHASGEAIARTPVGYTTVDEWFGKGWAPTILVDRWLIVRLAMTDGAGDWSRLYPAEGQVVGAAYMYAVFNTTLPVMAPAGYLTYEEVRERFGAERVACEYVPRTLAGVER